jgi:hypothetical protein
MSFCQRNRGSKSDCSHLGALKEIVVAAHDVIEPFVGGIPLAEHCRFSA